MESMGCARKSRPARDRLPSHTAERSDRNRPCRGSIKERIRSMEGSKGIGRDRVHFRRNRTTVASIDR